MMPHDPLRATETPGEAAQGVRTPHHADPWLTIWGGDCRDVLATLPAESVHCVVTSPPYWGLRDYGVTGQLGLESTPEEYVADMVAVFREVRRVLRDDGTVWLNLGDSYASSGGERTYGSSDGGTGRGPGTRRHDVPASGLKPKDLVGIPWRVAFALQADGWYLRSDIIWAKPNPMPESVTDRPTKAHEYLFLLSKAPRYFYDADAVREGADPASAKRYEAPFFVGPKHESGGYSSDGAKHTPGMKQFDGQRNRRSVWTVATQPYPGAHFAVMPDALVEPCILAGCPEGGTVLDPFGGSGTVARVANRLSRRAILIDLNPDYLAQQLERNRDMPLGLTA